MRTRINDTKSPRHQKSLVLTLVLLFSGLLFRLPAFAAETLTLETALKQVETQNSELKILSERLTYAQLMKSRSLSDVSDLERDLSNTTKDEQKLSIAIQAYVTPLRNTYEVDALTRERNLRLTTLKYEAEAAYRSIIDDKAALMLAKYNLNVAKKDETAKKLLFEMGRVARIEYDRAVVARSESELKVKALERGIELSYMKLNALIEKPSGARYELKTPAANLELPKIADLNAAVAYYKTKSNAILNQTETVAVAVKEVNVYRSYGVYKTIGSTSRIEGLAEKERNLNIETLRLGVVTRSADYDFRVAWNDVQTSYDSFVNAHGKYILSTKELEIARIRYERGLTTAQDYLKAAASNESARLDRQNAIKDFQLKRGSFMSDYAMEAFLAK